MVHHLSSLFVIVIVETALKFSLGSFVDTMSTTWELVYIPISRTPSLERAPLRSRLDDGLYFQQALVNYRKARKEPACRDLV